MYAAVCQTCSKEAHPVTILSHSRHTLGYRIIIAKVLGTQVCNPPKFSKCTITTFIHPIKPMFAVIGCIDTVDKGKTWWHSASNGLSSRPFLLSYRKINQGWIVNGLILRAAPISVNVAMSSNITLAETPKVNTSEVRKWWCVRNTKGHCLYRLYLEVLSSKLPKNV